MRILKLKFSPWCLAACIFLCGFFSVHAETAQKKVQVFFKDINLYVDSVPLNLFDGSGRYIEPFIFNDTTYLPLRAVAEALHMKVDWDQSLYCVRLTSGIDAPATKIGTITRTGVSQQEILVSYHDISIFVDGIRLSASSGSTLVEPFLYNDTVYLPLRIVAEATNSIVDWDPETNSIYICLCEKQIPSESLYDITTDSNWTLQKAQNYGYEVDMEKYLSKGYAYITKYSGTETDILVPSKIDGKTVCIDGVAKAFQDNKAIISVSFEDGVKALNYTDLFRNCSSLEAVYNLPAGGQSATNCFLGARNLRYVDRLPTTINSYINFFHSCKRLKTAPKIDKNATNTSGAFQGCATLEGDIYCESTSVEQANKMFEGTQKPINLHVPYPSLSYETFKNAELPDNISLVKTDIQIAFLPKEIYVSTYTTLPIYNYAVAPGFSDYTFQWECDIATPTDTGINLKGDETQLGAYPLTLTILDKGNEVAKLTSTVKLISAKLKKPMRLVTIGDSTAYSSAAWMRRVNALSESISFVGSRQGKHEGRMGYSSDKYLEQFNYTSDKNGLNELNPFYNPETNQFDWNYYKSYTSISPTAVQFLFGSTNAAADQTENINNIKTMVDAIQQADPKIQIFIAYIPYVKSGNAARDKAAFNFMIETEKVFSGYENVHFIPLSLTYNRDINYNEKNKAVPNEAGYEQFGTCIFAALAGQLQ